ncbi:hypothetical protein C1Y63_06350 [Corynebacterium sp. 13CS0277]|uniref:DUF3152 domain-containing protein n=1 Tax=Corynebacterium sp. 13CS0277 TaxID=2071994 RepID=UPI000D03B6DF|nr:DUF3152 domain-containing protein [Corynebacterium sp. 13CS0277]PRQ11461.1 hypothetical protein C1Y63_06350 [Corynebacterium sp. 13CS0277]
MSPHDSADAHRRHHRRGGSSARGGESAFARFARNYGWRAYAIPVLIVLTAWVIVDIARTPDATVDTTTVAEQGTDSADARATRANSPNPAKQKPVNLRDVSELPPGGPFAEHGTDTYHVVGRPGPKVGEGAEKTYTYVVEVEDGINTADYGGDDAVAAMIDATLNDPRGWTHDPDFAFQHVDEAQLPAGEEPDLRIQLSSTETTHKHCGNDIEMETSCFTPIGNRVLINESRWVRGAVPFQGDLGAYRQYLINHEVGHGIGYAAHEPCGGDGELAPVMMQQTLNLNNSRLREIAEGEIYPDDNATCRYNPWPYPAL